MDPLWLAAALAWLTGFTLMLVLLRSLLSFRLKLLDRLQRYGSRSKETPEEIVDRELAAQRASQRGLRRSLLGSRRLQQWLAKMQVRLQAAGIPMTGKEFAAIVAGVGLVGSLFGYLLGGMFMALICAPVGLMLPFLWLMRVEAARRRRMKDQIPELLVMMGNALQAGHGFVQAAQIASREIGSPVGDEFQKMLQETSIGATTEGALRNLGERMNDEDMDMVITAVLIQRQVGGNLAEVLSNIHETIRERIRLQGHISALTAQGRLSGIIISVLPIVIGGFIFVNSPNFLEPLLTETAGQIMLAAAVLLEIAGIFVIRRIVQIEV